jgi:hypothetical protein
MPKMRKQIAVYPIRGKPKIFEVERVGKYIVQLLGPRGAQYTLVQNEQDELWYMVDHSAFNPTKPVNWEVIG